MTSKLDVEKAMLMLQEAGFHRVEGGISYISRGSTVPISQKRAFWRVSFLEEMHFRDETICIRPMNMGYNRQEITPKETLDCIVSIARTTSHRTVPVFVSSPHDVRHLIPKCHQKKYIHYEVDENSVQAMLSGRHRYGLHLGCRYIGEKRRLGKHFKLPYVAPRGQHGIMQLKKRECKTGVAWTVQFKPSIVFLENEFPNLVVGRRRLGIYWLGNVIGNIQCIKCRQNFHSQNEPYFYILQSIHIRTTIVCAFQEILSSLYDAMLNKYARVIQRGWREAISNPNHVVCQRRLMHEFNEF